MALHLNLYHEVHKQKALQRRDPLKFAVLGLVVLAVALAGYYLFQLNSQRLVSNELKQLENEHATVSRKAEEAKKREVEVSETLKIRDLIVQRMEQRFYWAPILASIVEVVPAEVQITKFAGDVVNDEPRRCSLSIDGIAAGSDPRKVAEDLRRALTEQFSSKYKSVTSKFRSLEDSPDTALLNGERVPTAIFGITLLMQVGETPEPQATARTAKN